MKIKIFLFLLLNSISALSQQQLPTNPICITADEPRWIAERAKVIEANVGSVTELKLVRVNFHIVSKTDGTGHFTETGDHLGNNYSGYNLAYDVIDYMDNRMNWNQQMNILPGNSTPANPKKWKFILDGVYFIHNTTYHTFPSINTTNYPLVGHKTDSVLNIFLTEGSGNYGGYASNLSPNSKVKYTENRNFYASYAAWNFANPIAWLYDTYSAQLNHELTHLLGLSHTVRYNTGPPCPTAPIDVSCDDGCGDTPTAWDAQAVTGHHPACGWGHQWTSYCSSNMMDYSGGNSLTPCQLNIIHTNLDNGMKSYRVCAAVNHDITLCNMKYPEVSYYGKRVTLGNCGNSIVVDNNQRKDIYFSEEVTIQNTEIKGGTEFEIFYWHECP